MSVFHMAAAEADSDILDLDDQFTPSALYAGTGGKPPMSFNLADNKSSRKRCVCVSSCVCVYLFNLSNLLCVHLSG